MDASRAPDNSDAAGGATELTPGGGPPSFPPSASAPAVRGSLAGAARRPSLSESTAFGSPEWRTSLPQEDLSQESVLARAPRANLNGLDVPILGGIPLLAKLGKGGMGAVYYGYHPRLGIEVAVKVLPLGLAEEHPDMVQRFFREAQVAARIKSPNLVGVLDVNEDAGISYIVMEFVNGGSAGDYLKEAKNQGQLALPELDAVEICTAATAGLAAAHAKGIIHRDIKPVNIMIPMDEAGARDLAMSKLGDLGLARPESMDQALTAAQTVMGTLGYMAPEQAEDAALAGKPADVHGLGATLFALLAGVPPYRGSTPSKTLMMTLQQPPPSLTEFRTDLRPETVDMVASCLEKAPENRVPDGEQLLRAFHKLRRLIIEAQGGPRRDHVTIALPRPRSRASVAPEAKAEAEAARQAEEARQRQALEAAAKAEAERRAREAEAALRAAEARRDQESEARQNLNVALMFALEAKKGGEWQQIVASLTRALEQLGHLEHPNREAAQALLAQAQEARAKQAQVPEGLTRAEALVKHGRYAEAQQLFEALRDCYPHPAELLRLENGLAAAAAGAAAVAPVRAAPVRPLPSAVFRAPNRASLAQEQRFLGLVQAGEQRLTKGAWDEAEALFTQALQLKPDDPAARHNLELVAKGRAAAAYDAALAEARQLLAGEPASPDGYYPSLSDEKRAAVEAATARALAVAPDDPEAKALQGKLGWPPWDGRHSLWEYAQRLSLQHAVRLEAGRVAKLDLALIPAGSFQMGSPPHEAGRDLSEVLHPVAIRQPFYMSRCPIAQAEFEAIMESNPSHFVGERNPVERVTWEEAVEFCERLSQRTRRKVRLPTEAEWEYACRAGTQTPYNVGNAEFDLDRVAWHKGNSGNTTHPVGEKEANGFGLSDLHGNVGEWCQDWFGEHYYREAPPADPPGPATGASRVVRGGAWSSAPASCRSASRDRYRPVNRYDIVGFRIVVTL